MYTQNLSLEFQIVTEEIDQTIDTPKGSYIEKVYGESEIYFEIDKVNNGEPLNWVSTSDMTDAEFGAMIRKAIIETI